RGEEELEFWVRTPPLQRRRIAPSDKFRRPPPLPPNNWTSPSQIPSSPTGEPRKQIPLGLSVILATDRSCRESRSSLATRTSSGLIPLSPFLFRRPRRIG